MKSHHNEVHALVADVIDRRRGTPSTSNTAMMPRGSAALRTRTPKPAKVKIKAKDIAEFLLQALEEWPELAGRVSPVLGFMSVEVVDQASYDSSDAAVLISVNDDKRFLLSVEQTDQKSCVEDEDDDDEDDEDDDE